MCLMDSLSQHQASGAAQVHDGISSTASEIATEKSKFSEDTCLTLLSLLRHQQLL